MTDGPHSFKPHSFKKDWTVTQAAFDRLLQQLDPDRDTAGERYEQLRQKLTRLFQWRGCQTPEDLADRTIDRAARRIEEGVTIDGGQVYPFFHGIALNLLREYWKEVEKRPSKPLDETPELRAAEEPGKEREARLECLDRCVAGLPGDQLKLITEYHQDQGGAKIARRKELAKELNVPLNALRIRAFRIREELETCIHVCVERVCVDRRAI